MPLFDVVRLLAAAILLALSSLAVFRGRTRLLWMIAITVTEWAHVLAFICIGAAVVLLGPSWSGRLAVLLCAAAATLALVPLWRAVNRAPEVRKELLAAFGNAEPSRSSPLIYRDLFRGLSPPEIKPQVLT